MQNVKSTMIDHLLSYLAPHLCCGCGKLGVLLCDNCKYNIVSEQFGACIVCGYLAGANGMCFSCRLPYGRAWCVGERSGELRHLLNRYKFEGARTAYRPLALLLHEVIDQLPANTVIIPIPIIPTHIRQRGYDHTLLIAGQLAKLRGLRMERPLQRITTTRQLGASRSERVYQARQAFKVRQKLSGDVPYLLVDDIVTTGSTVKYATKAMRQAGAKDIWVAVVARQPLD